MSKKSNRAHIDKNLEDLLDNDWRVFRAKLVAQEALEAEQAYSRPQPLEYRDERLAEQKYMGDLFAGSVGPYVFDKMNTRKKQNQHNDDDLFEGRSIGQADIPMDFETQDPFVSADEIPTLMKPKVKLDRHRWAHQIPNIEPGCIIVANEKLKGAFHQTVVLVVDHDEIHGTLGIIINRPHEKDLQTVATEAEANLNWSLKSTFEDSPVAYGGPCLTEEFSILHSFGEVEGSKKLANGVFIGGSDELADEVKNNGFDPANALFVQGHAAWIPGQLQHEIDRGVWYCAAASSDLIMRHAGAPVYESDDDDLWTDVMTCMGGIYGRIARAYKSNNKQGSNKPMP
jgi:putative transcriptional regulator